MKTNIGDNLTKVAQKLSEDLEYSVESSYNSNYKINFLMWYRVVHLYILYKFLKYEENICDILKQYINIVSFYKYKKYKKNIIKEVRECKFKNNILDVHRISNWDELVKRAISPNNRIVPKWGVLDTSQIVSGYMNPVATSYSNPIIREIEKFKVQEFYKTPRAGAPTLRSYWEEKALQFPNERPFYKKVIESIDYNADKINEKFADRETITGQDLMEII